MSDPLDRRSVRATAVERLEAAGVASPAYDADELLAHVLGTTRGRLALVDALTSEQAAAYDALVARRAAREPLQHLTGTAAFRHVELAVGPGVFVPRPETELLAGWAIEQAAVAAGAGRGRPVHRLRRHREGAGGRGARTRASSPSSSTRTPTPGPSATSPAPASTFARVTWPRRSTTCVGTVDVVVCNPPYVPLEAWESVAAEARDHDPHLALFSGLDGLDAIRALEQRAAALLRPGGVVGFEHADVQGESAPAVLAATGRWREVRDHQDLAGRPRWTTARLAL